MDGWTGQTVNNGMLHYVYEIVVVLDSSGQVRMMQSGTNVC